MAPLVAVKASARWEVLSVASIVGELEVENDFNDYSLVPPVPEIPTLLPAQLTATGQLFLQARF